MPEKVVVLSQHINLGRRQQSALSIVLVGPHVPMLVDECSPVRPAIQACSTSMEIPSSKLECRITTTHAQVFFQWMRGRFTICRVACTHNENNC